MNSQLSSSSVRISAGQCRYPASGATPAARTRPSTSRPAEAVPPGRMRHDISEDRILLHTIQTAEAFGALLSNGMLRPDPALAEPPLHADGYDWMFRQMAARLPTFGDGAIWLWARIRRQDTSNRYCRHRTIIAESTDIRTPGESAGSECGKRGVSSSASVGNRAARPSTTVAPSASRARSADIRQGW